MDDSTFSLWTPVTAGADTYEFDVVPEAFEQLNEGTVELVRSFLAALGLPEEPADWDIDPFRTPYYAALPAAEHWRDRYRQAWRVHVRVHGDGARVSPLTRWRAVVSGSDATWSDPVDQPILEAEVVPVVVIADFADGTWRNAAADVERLGKFETHDMGDDTMQLRIDCGPIALPAESTRVDRIAASCRAAGGSVHWADAPPTEW